MSFSTDPILMVRTAYVDPIRGTRFTPARIGSVHVRIAAVTAQRRLVHPVAVIAYQAKEILWRQRRHADEAGEAVAARVNLSDRAIDGDHLCPSDVGQASVHPVLGSSHDVLRRCKDVKLMFLRRSKELTALAVAETLAGYPLRERINPDNRGHQTEETAPTHEMLVEGAATLPPDRA